MVMETIEVCGDDLAFLQHREQFWIATYREQFAIGIRTKSLLNVRDGGDFIPAPSETQRKAWSMGRSGDCNPMYGLRGMDHPAFGFKHGDTERERRSQRLRGEGNTRAKISEALVKDLRIRYDSGESGASLAREYGLSKGHVSNIINRKAWKHVQ